MTFFNLQSINKNNTENALSGFWNCVDGSASYDVVGVRDECVYILLDSEM